MYRYPDYLEFFHRKMAESGEEKIFNKSLSLRKEVSNAQFGEVA